MSDARRIFSPTGRQAQKVRVTGYLLWDDEHIWIENGAMCSGNFTVGLSCS
jgi:hypothetical protein